MSWVFFLWKFSWVITSDVLVYTLLQPTCRGQIGSQGGQAPGELREAVPPGAVDPSGGASAPINIQLVGLQLMKDDPSGPQGLVCAEYSLSSESLGHLPTQAWESCAAGGSFWVPNLWLYL